MQKETILKAFQFRQATKKYDTTKKISPEDFNYLLEVARLSPTSIGFEPFKILVLENKELRDKIMEKSWGGSTLGNASHSIMFLSQTRNLMTKEYLNNFMKEVKKLPDEVIGNINNLFEKFAANDFKIDDDKSFNSWTSKQTYIVAANMMTAAAMIGIDSCPIEGFTIDAVENILAKDYQIDTTLYKPSLMVTFGYRDEPQREKTRRDLKDIVIVK